jgi:hypothetical protein
MDDIAAIRALSHLMQEEPPPDDAVKAIPELVRRRWWAYELPQGITAAGIRAVCLYVSAAQPVG